MEAEKINAEQNKDTFTVHSNIIVEVPGPLAANGVFFQCPMIGNHSISLI